MEKEIAIKVENISKTFRIPHEKISSLKDAFVNVLGDKGYEEFQALDDVSFEVKKGEFFGIIGRNGSGKSTLLKILAGIYKPDKGKIKINGLISPFLELGIGFNPELSGRDNVYLNATVLGLTHKQIDEKFNDIVEFSELRRFIDQKVKNYSSGMQVRLAFSVAIHANRDILLMDEVLAVGDSNFQSKCLDEFNKYRDAGKTVVLVTHDIGTIQRYCDRAMLLREGNIQMIGKPIEVGNEYIFQNMGDEEERMIEEEKMIKVKTKKIKEEKNKKEKSHLGNNAIILTNIEILDEERKKKKIFNPQDDIVVRMHFRKNNNEIKKAVFGLEIFNNRGYQLFGFNTSMIKKPIEIKNEMGYIDFELQKIPFLNGKYKLTPAIADETGKIQYYYWKQATEFIIMNKNYEGFIYGDVSIKVKINEGENELAG